MNPQNIAEGNPCNDDAKICIISLALAIPECKCKFDINMPEPIRYYHILLASELYT